MASLKSTRWREMSGRAKYFLRRELPVFFIWLALLAGAINFLLIVDNYWEALSTNWWWLVVAVATLKLPKTFRAVRDSKAPILVRFALAFREGFLSLPQISRGLSGWQKRGPNLWQRGNKRAESDLSTRSVARHHSSNDNNQ